jgi:hypothetical protein
MEFRHSGGSSEHLSAQLDVAKEWLDTPCEGKPFADHAVPGQGRPAKVVVLCWGANDFRARKGFSFVDEKLREYLCMISKAVAVGDMLIMVGPGSAATWELGPQWDECADAARRALTMTHVVHHAGENCFHRWERLPGDPYHPLASEHNDRVFGRFLGTAVMFALDAFSVRRACFGPRARAVDAQTRYGSWVPYTLASFGQASHGPLPSALSSAEGNLLPKTVAASGVGGTGAGVASPASHVGGSVVNPWRSLPQLSMSKVSSTAVASRSGPYTPVLSQPQRTSPARTKSPPPDLASRVEPPVSRSGARAPAGTSEAARSASSAATLRESPPTSSLPNRDAPAEACQRPPCRRQPRARPGDAGDALAQTRRRRPARPSRIVWRACSGLRKPSFAEWCGSGTSSGPMWLSKLHGAGDCRR